MHLIRANYLHKLNLHTIFNLLLACIIIIKDERYFEVVM